MKRFRIYRPVMVVTSCALLALAGGCIEQKPELPEDQVAFFKTMTALKQDYEHAQDPPSVDKATAIAHIKTLLWPSEFTSWVGSFQGMTVVANPSPQEAETKTSDGASEKTEDHVEDGAHETDTDAHETDTEEEEKEEHAADDTDEMDTNEASSEEAEEHAEGDSHGTGAGDTTSEKTAEQLPDAPKEATVAKAVAPFTLSVKLYSGDVPSVTLVDNHVTDHAIFETVSKLKAGADLAISGTLTYLNRTCLINCDDPLAFITNPVISVTFTQVAPIK